MSIDAPPALTLDGALHRHPNGAGVGPIDLAVRPGQVHAIVGLNGAGKSTLMRLALRMVDAQAGTVSVHGTPVSEAGSHVWTRVGHAVDGAESYPELTVAQNLLIAARWHGLAPHRARTAARELMRELELSDLAGRRVRASSGNRQRTRIAAARAGDRHDRSGGRRHRAGILRPRARRHHASIMTPALWVEAVKAMRGTTTWVVVAAVALGPASIGVALLLAARNDNAVAAAQLEPFTGGDPWGDLATLMGVIGAAGGLLAFGTYLAWSFGREFTDRTIGSMFAIPTSLRQIATAKLALYAAVVSLTTAICVAAYLVAGLAMHYPGTDTLWTAALKLAAVLALTGLLATPCAWAATASKGVLGAVGLAVALLALSQVAVFTVGAWFPFAVPGAWAGLAGAGPIAPNGAQLLLAVVDGAGSAALTVHRWGHLRLR